jgi:hypothetical protein
LKEKFAGAGGLLGAGESGISAEKLDGSACDSCAALVNNSVWA